MVLLVLVVLLTLETLLTLVVFVVLVVLAGWERSARMDCAASTAATLLASLFPLFLSIIACNFLALYLRLRNLFLYDVARLDNVGFVSVVV